jgi:hypothetical protein
MKRLIAPTLLLALATLGHAQERPGATYRIQGADASRGFFSGDLDLRLRPDRRFDAQVSVRFAGGLTVAWRGAVAGDGRKLAGDLDCTAGLVGALIGGQPAVTRLQVQVDPVSGACKGRVASASRETIFWGAREVAVVTGDAYEALSPAEKQARLWREVSSAPYGSPLPALGSRGVGENIMDTFGALRLKLLDRTFSDASDQRAPRTKIFHPFGASARVVYEARSGHPFTGFFASGGIGLARLSLATDDQSYIPGIGLKLFVQGRPSVNIHAIPSFDEQTSRDFFERAPTNEIPAPTNFAIKLFSRIARRIADPLRRPLDHIAAISADGRAVSAPVAPRRIHFRPARVHFPATSPEDFRIQLATVPVGSVIYAVYAETDAGEVHIGDVRTQSPIVASEWSDRSLHFLHAR